MDEEVYIHIYIYIYIYIYTYINIYIYKYIYNKCKFIVDLYWILNYQKCELFIVTLPFLAIWSNIVYLFVI